MGACKRILGVLQLTERPTQSRYKEALMKRSAVPALLLCVAVSLCVFSPLALSAQDSARVQTGPREYWEDHHDTSMSLLDMIRFYPQPNPPAQSWVRPVLPIPPREYPQGVKDRVLQNRSFGPLAATIGL